jgi:hypothetical protein
MNGRSLQGMPKAVDVAWLFGNDAPSGAARRRRRTLAALLIGAGILALGLGSLEAGIAAGLINGANSPISFIMGQVLHRGAAMGGAEATAPPLAWNSHAGAHKRIDVAAAVSVSSPLPRRSVCVRLCDGYFFPVAPISSLGDLAAHEATCAGQCPDAPTQLFIEPAGSDRIEDAVSTNGARYAALPMALSNRSSAFKTCSCHRRPGEMVSLRNDFTLRRGDSIMTRAGIVVFRGSGRLPYAQNDFTALARASMPADKRQILAAIERAALPSIRQSGFTPLPPRKAQIAFAAPSPERPNAAPMNKSIHFVEPSISASN